jgi:GNAT superfamily N-acetyltransferase
MQGMRAKIGRPVRGREITRDITQVRVGGDLDDWHGVYREVFGADSESLSEWRRLYEALGPSGEDSLILHLARIDGAPAATAAVFFHDTIAGLYCFTTRKSMRGRGLASALIDASHAAASARGINQALLHATPSGRSVYARAGYVDERPLPVLIVP